MAPQLEGICQEVLPNLGGLDDEGERQLAVPVCPADASSSGLDGGGVYGQEPGQRGVMWAWSAISPATAETDPSLLPPLVPPLLETTLPHYLLPLPPLSTKEKEICRKHLPSPKSQGPLAWPAPSHSQ